MNCKEWVSWGYIGEGFSKDDRGLKTEGQEGTSLAQIWGKSIPGRGHSKCKFLG
jgi:hypothetical protein